MKKDISSTNAADALALLNAEPDDWKKNPADLSDYLKGLFVATILAEMHEQGISQTKLAKLWGCSRQNVSRVLNEDSRTNFTIETMVELSLLLDLELDIRAHKPEPEVPWYVSCLKASASESILDYEGYSKVTYPTEDVRIADFDEISVPA